MTIRKTARSAVAQDRTEEALEAIRVFVSHAAQSEKGTLLRVLAVRESTDRVPAFHALRR